MASRSLGGIFKGSNEFWDVIVIVVICICCNFVLCVKITQLLLQELVLLRAHLLKDIGHHLFKALRLWRA